MVEAELLLLGVVHEVSLLGEGPVVVPGELVRHQTAGLDDAAGVLEPIDQRPRRQRGPTLPTEPPGLVTPPRR